MNRKEDYSAVKKLVDAAQHIVVIQAENPDGDSVGSAMALEEILGDLGKIVTLYCPVQIGSYLGYIKGCDRIVDELPHNFDLSIIVDTASATLLERAIEPANLAQIKTRPSIVIDHHSTEGTIPFEHLPIIDASKVATGELIYEIAKTNSWDINPQASEDLVISILADSLGLITENTTSSSIRAVANLVDCGASLCAIDTRRREFMKKSPEILSYKGQLLQRVEYFADGELALVHIPWEEITEYSAKYNPSMLVIDEMRLVNDVKLAICLKTYPDGKITGKIRCNPGYKIAETVAKYFGGGGHAYVAGFRTYSDNFDEVKAELIGAVNKILKEYKTKE